MIQGPAGEGIGVREHSYPCRFDAVGKCVAGSDCRFKHASDKPRAVMSISKVEPSVYNISVVQEDESLAVEVCRPSRFKEFAGVDTFKYRYV